MNTCPHTGITVPECSCRACVGRLIEQHMPAALAAARARADEVAAVAPAPLPGDDLIPTAIADAPGPRGILRRLRRTRRRDAA